MKNEAWVWLNCTHYRRLNHGVSLASRIRSKRQNVIQFEGPDLILFVRSNFDMARYIGTLPALQQSAAEIGSAWQFCNQSSGWILTVLDQACRQYTRNRFGR